MKFSESFEELKATISKTGVRGDWQDNGDKKQFKTSKGTILNWWPSTGTISFQGAAADKGILEETINGKNATTVAVETVKQRIFVVHGHDDVARDQLELILRRFDLDPYVLMNTSGGGLTIIEALEEHIGKEGTAEFGIVLMTPDDMGFAKREGDKEIKPRARQNVILEMGMLLSSLTRDKVAILVKGYVEVPSDAHGIIYLHFNDHVKEVVPKLAERLQLAGIEITPQQISMAMA